MDMEENGLVIRRIKKEETVVKIELRWFKSVDDSDYKLQYRDANCEICDICVDWKEVPFILDGEDMDETINRRTDKSLFQIPGDKKQ